MDINELVQQNVDMYNNRPMDSFDGFSPFQMSQILYFPFEKECPIKINTQMSESLLEKSPIFKIVLSLLTKIEVSGTNLTAVGNLPPQIVKGIYHLRYYPDLMIEHGITKLTNEKDWLILHTVKIVLIQAGILRKSHRKLLFTKKGRKYFEDAKYDDLFYLFLRAFTTKFNWAYNDGFENEQIGQLGFLYSLYLLQKHGESYKELRYYGDLYFKAFPIFKSLRKTSANNYDSTETAYYTRFFGRFCIWFGFVDIPNSPSELRINHMTKVKKSNLLSNLLRL
jgi:hypothetical protein